MLVTREVDFQLDMNRLLEAVEPAALYAALGYFLQWGLDGRNYTHLTVAHGYTFPHLVAYYATDALAAPSYVLGAVYRPEARRYEHHS